MCVHIKKRIHMTEHSKSSKYNSILTLDLPLSKNHQEFLAIDVMRPPYPLAGNQAIYDVFGNDYCPGLFFISERKSQPNFLSKEEGNGYDVWLRSMIYSYLRSLQSAGYISKKLDESMFENIGNACLKVIDTPTHDGLALCERITNQQVTDVLSRIIKAIITGNMFAPIHVFKQFNDYGKKLAFDILGNIDSSDLVMNLRRSIIAGSVGLDVKRSQTIVGPSPIVTDNTIDIYSSNKFKQSSLVQAEIDKRATSCLAIDFCHEFLNAVIDAKYPISLIWFTDDLIETVFDLYNIQTWLKININLNAIVTPKHGQHANDASYEDIVEILKNPLFAGLRSNLGSRFSILMAGPAGSGINAFEFAPTVLNALKSADVVVFKGARAFEMAQGLNKHVFYGFNVLRSFTESLTGLNGANAPAVFLYQEPGLHSFKGFRERAVRKKIFGKRSIGIAKMTAVEYSATVKSNNIL